MAYFAELNSDNIVIDVQIVDDKNIRQGDDSYNEQWCQNNLVHSPGGVSWKQTFKHGSDRANLRGRYAGKGMKYYTTSIPGHPESSGKFLDILQEESYYSLCHLDEDFNWCPNLPIPAVDDQGRSLPYDENKLPSDRLFWGFDLENNRYQGSRLINDIEVKKYYNPTTLSWIEIT
jgi:hypothetical protein